MPCWYFDRKEIKNSPSYSDGIDSSVESRYRREGARFILDAGTKMGLRYDTCATGVVYFHRFYMFHSFKEFYRYVTAACCLFLAGKVEETPKKCKDIVKTAQSLLSPASFLRFGSDPREEVMTMERILLKTIKFDLQVEHPYGALLKYAKLLKGEKEKTQKMAQMAWTFINDSLCTTLCLQWEPEIISVSLMYLASRLAKFEPTDWSGRTSSKLKWYEDFLEGMSLELMEDICHQVLDLYSKQKKMVEDSPPMSPAKGAKTTPPPPSHPVERIVEKRTREDTPTETEATKIMKIEREVKPSTRTTAAPPIPTGAPIPVAQHIKGPPSQGYPPEPNSDFSSFNPYVSSQMYSASFLSSEGSQDIQSILSGSGPAPPAVPYSDPIPPPPSMSYPPIIPPPVPFGFPPVPDSQYPSGNLPPLPHSFPPASAASMDYVPPSTSSYTPPQSSSYLLGSYPQPTTQPPPHAYPPPPLPSQAYSGYSYSSPAPDTTIPPPPHMTGSYPPQSSFNNTPHQSGHNKPFSKNWQRGNYHNRNNRQGGNNRKDIPALTEIKITGRPEWGGHM